METYLVKEEWQNFRAFIIEHLKDLGRDAILCMYKSNEIYIMYTNEEVYKRISIHYNIVPVEHPSNFFDKDRGWQYFGNEALIKLKL